MLKKKHIFYCHYSLEVGITTNYRTMKEQENAFDKKESYLEIPANEKYMLKYNI